MCMSNLIWSKICEQAIVGKMKSHITLKGPAILCKLAMLCAIQLSEGIKNVTVTNSSYGIAESTGVPEINPADCSMSCSSSS